jgi:CDP-diacylglycerol--glycerol-3-phosphate 3-phosphatidyltransferase
MLDGRVARAGARVTSFGAFYDSTLDRVGDAALFGGITLFFVRGGVRPDLVTWALTAALVALSATLIVSYARARAEGLSLDCRVGIAQRAERILGLGIPSMFIGAGPDGLVLFGIVALLGVLSVITVGQRIAHVRKITRPMTPAVDASRQPRATQARQLASDLSEFTHERNGK